MSLDRLLEAGARMGNPSVVGLDPTPAYIPPHIWAACAPGGDDPLEWAAAAYLEYNKGIIDAVHDIVPAVKPQAAYYEAIGWQGMRALHETVRYAKGKGMFVIIDGKRNDIGSTMEAYARAHLGRTEINGRPCAAFDGDALTINAYLGSDGVHPLFDCCNEGDKGIFVLVRTSNPSAVELQDRVCDGSPVYLLMGGMCETWGGECPGRHGYSGVGAVVGATWPEQLRGLRAALPHTVFLVPGYGAQGGGAADVAGAFDRRGWGAVVNSSRAVLTAWQREGGDGRDFAGAARREALRMRDEIVSVLPPIAPCAD